MSTQICNVKSPSQIGPCIYERREKSDAHLTNAGDLSSGNNSAFAYLFTFARVAMPFID